MSNSALPTFSGNGRLEQIEAVVFTPVNAGVLLLPLKEYTEKYVRWYRRSLVGIEYLASWSIITPFRIGVTVKNIANYTTVASGELSVSSTNGNYYFEGEETLSFNTEVNQQYEIEYSLYCRDASTNTYSATVTYVIAVVENKYPLKKWTVTDVVNRCLELAEPLQVGENPRYHLDGVVYENGEAKKTYTVGSQAEKYNEVLAPEFSFAKMTLREQLKQVGGYIHAEPRLKNGVVFFDEYGRGEISSISLKKPISTQLSQSVNEFCTEIDSTGDNLVNRIDYAQGVVIEPFSGGFQSIRTETMTVRIEEGNGIIQTQRPIYEIKRVLCKYATEVVDGLPTAWSDSVDISAYLFESAEYKNLSSFAGAFPFSKEYALEFTQGSKNIKGLFFKPPDITGGVISNYSIVKILEAEGIPKSNITENNYAILSFEVSYIPVFSQRIKTNKALIIGKRARTIAYNQSAPLIETRYFGEALKGVVARLGNTEKTLTYKVAFLSDIPKTGEMFDDEYYISAVSVEYLPFFIKVTIGLSKDFNRLSQYVGVSSNLRLYEVSEKMSSNRDSVLVNYLVVGDEVAPGNYTGYATENFINRVRDMFVSLDLDDYSQINQALVRGRSFSKSLITPSYAISLPVISSAMGNNMTFSFNFEDSYSAGQKSVYRPAGTDRISGYFGQYIPYANYYGRLWWLEFALYSKLGVESDPLDLPQLDYGSNDLPLGAVNGHEAQVYSGNKYLRYRKESTETPSLTYQLAIVSNQEGYIIGSALTRNCSLVTGKKSPLLKLYILKDRLNAYDEFVDLTNAVELENSLLVQYGGSASFKLADFLATTNGKSWAIVSKQTTTYLTVEDETGQVTTQEIKSGGELYLGKNIDIANGNTVKMPVFRIKRKIYE